MNLMELVIKQMRQRALSTWLTLLSVMLGVSLAIVILILYRESDALFAQRDFGYDIIVGPPKGSPLQLTLNTVYHMDVSPGVVPYELYEDMARKTAPPPGHPDYRPYVRHAVPFMVGDSFQGRRIVGTSPRLFNIDDQGKPIVDRTFEYRIGQSYELADGRVFASRKFEAVIGSDVARSLRMRLYDNNLSDEENEKRGGAFRATHGMPGPDEKPDIHKPRWHIVGILKPTHTANDRVLFISFVSLYAIAEHEAGMIDQALLKAGIDPARIPPERVDEVLAKLGYDPKTISESVRKKFKQARAATRPTATAPTKDIGELMSDATIKPSTEPAKEEEGEDEDAFHLDEHGDIVPDLPQEEWALSAILVQSRGSVASQQLLYNFKVIDNRASAANPASVMRDFFNTFLKGTGLVLLVIAVFVTVVAGVGILVSIYNSVSARMREIAILRALGATRLRILSLICLEAALIGLAGAFIGLAGGHALAGVSSLLFEQKLGEPIHWLSVGLWEWAYVAAVVVLAALAGLVPAMKAYQTDVATNLAGG